MYRGCTHILRLGEVLISFCFREKGGGEVKPPNIFMTEIHKVLFKASVLFLPLEELLKKI